MKILYYSPHPQLRSDAPTGYGTHMREMIAAWRRMGIEVKTLIAGEQGSPAEAEMQNRGVVPRYSGWKKFIPPLIWESVRDLSLQRFDRMMEAELVEFIADFQPDVVYERVNYLQDSGINAARKMEVKHIAEINAPYPEERVAFSGRSLLTGRARKTERSFLLHSHGISVVSSALKKYLEEKTAEKSTRIAVIPNAVNPKTDDEIPQKAKALRAKYGLDDSLVIGFVGSMFPYHGVDILIKAFAEIHTAHKIRLLIVGDGAILSDLKQLTHTRGISGKVIFTGSRPYREVYALIDCMDICVMPKSNWYGSPVKIFEYGLRNKPVIAPDVVPVRDVMTAEDGILVSANVLDFSEALVLLIKNAALRNRLAGNWHNKVVEKYTWDAAAKNTLDLCT